MKDEKIIIIDGSSYFFRAFFAIQHLSNSKGLPTNAIYGFINMLAKVIEDEKPSKLAITFDTPKPTFRKQMYAEYKANRERPPEDLVVQIPFIQRAVDCFQIFRLEKEGYEADDVIGTLVKRAREEGYKVDIISGDKDLMQLVDEDVTLFDTMKDKRIGPKQVEEKFGVLPEKMIDLLALMGDSSDNVPGVQGIGPKTAAQLLNEYETLDGLYDNLDKIKQPKRRQTLHDQKDNAYLSQKLVTLCTEVPVNFSWSDLDYNGPNTETLLAFFEEMEFQALIKRFGMASTEEKVEKGSYETISTDAQLKKLGQTLKKSKQIALDTETTSLNPREAELVGISLSTQSTKAYYIPINHKTELPQLTADAVRAVLKPILEDESIAKVGQNLKYDYQILKAWGISLAGIFSDTMLVSYLLDPEQSHGLDALANRHLKHQNIAYQDVVGKGKSQISFAEVELDKATEYAAEDADMTFRLQEKLYPRLEKEKLGALFHDIEMPLVTVLAEMEYEGISVNQKKLEAMNKDLAQDIAKIKAQTFQIAGEEFNLNSPKQLSGILFEKLKLPVIKKTKTGFSTDEGVLEQLSKEHEIAKWILKHRELGKLQSTYVEGLLGQINSQTGRVHSHFNQTVTATGRLSSSNPNLQNIPVSSEGKYDIRSVFIAGEGNELFFPDYSQVELRILAHMSQDKELLKAFANEEDVHEYTGKLIFGVDEVSPEQRRVAKTINFGVIYGQTPFGLSQQLKIAPKQAKSFIESYFERYSGVKTFMAELVEGARKNGYVTTLMGRRRFLGEINSQNRIRREMAERTAINTPIQGTAADMIKIAMVSIDQKLKSKKLKTKMLLQVHDELVFEVPKSEKKTVESLVCETMESALPIDIKVKVDPAWGECWSK